MTTETYDPEAAYDLVNLHTEEYVGPASDEDVAAYFWWCSKGRPWIYRRGYLCRVRKVNLYRKGPLP